MSRWQEQYNQHEIHKTIKGIQEALAPENIEVPEESISEHRRLLKIIDLFEDYINQIDPEIAPFPQIDGLNNHLKQHVHQQIVQFKSTNNAGHLTNANNQLTSQLINLSNIIPISKRSRSTKPTKKLEHQVDSAIKKLSQKNKLLDDEMGELSILIEEKSKSLEELSALIEKRKTETDTILSEWQEQFSNSQERRNEEFNSWRERLNENSSNTINSLVEKINTQIDRIQTKLTNETNEILDDSRNKHKAILDLYELTAGDSVASGYLKSSQNEAKKADLWRAISILFILATVVWLAINGLKTAPNDFSWQRLLVTFSLSGVLLWGSAFSAQQSTKHRDIENKARWFALEIKAIDPFISSLGTAERSSLKHQLSERLFGQNTSNGGDIRVIDEHALNVLVGAITKILGKVPKN